MPAGMVHLHWPLPARQQDAADQWFRTALTPMLLDCAGFRWSRIEAPETITVGELLEELVATATSSLPPPGRLLPSPDRRLAGAAATSPDPSETVDNSLPRSFVAPPRLRVDSILICCVRLYCLKSPPISRL